MLTNICGDDIKTLSNPIQFTVINCKRKQARDLVRMRRNIELAIGLQRSIERCTDGGKGRLRGDLLRYSCVAVWVELRLN